MATVCSQTCSKRYVRIQECGFFCDIGTYIHVIFIHKTPETLEKSTHTASCVWNKQV